MEEILGLDQIEVQNTSIEELDSEIVNLMFCGIDGSGSMHSFTSAMQQSLKEFKDGIIDSKESDTILIARADFSESNVDVGGYKKIDEFDTDYTSDGQTPLYDTIVIGVDKLLKYMDFLKQQGMRVKAVFSIFSDGEDTNSQRSMDDARQKISELNKREIVTAYISFGDEALDEARRLGFKNILPVGSNSSELRRAFNCLSKSVAENSKAVVNNTEDFFQV